ncbi:amidinotransferase, partial [Mesorhizobium sp. M7A.T.Ca.TU.009.01.1.2]
MSAFGSQSMAAPLRRVLMRSALRMALAADRIST